jgi:hypothetical protein
VFKSRYELQNLKKTIIELNLSYPSFAYYILRLLSELMFKYRRNAEIQVFILFLPHLAHLPHCLPIPTKFMKKDGYQDVAKEKGIFLKEPIKYDTRTLQLFFVCLCSLTSFS